MKKIFLTFIAIITLFSLTACSLLVYERPQISIKEPTVGSQNEPEPTDTKPTESVSEDPDKIFAQPTLNEQIIYNQNNIIVTVVGIEYDGWFGPELLLLIENNSEKNITVQARNSSVNGYMIDFQTSTDVVAGKKAYGDIVIPNNSLKMANIDTIANIEFSLHIFESTSYDAIADSNQISLSTNVASPYIQTYDDSGVALYDENGIRIIAKGFSLDSNFFGPELILYIENNADKYITIQTRDTSVNGFMIDSIMSDEVLPGKKIMGLMTFSSSRLEESKVTDIETIETVFHIFDTDTWDTIIDTDPITINFEK